MKFKKTHRDNRGTYKYVYEHQEANGCIRKEIVELRPGVDGITELDIQRLHRRDDSDVYYNLKNVRPERTEKEKAEIKAWKIQFKLDFAKEYGYEPIDEYVDDVAEEIFPMNYNLSLNEYDDECEDGKNPIYSMIADGAIETDSRVERLREVVELLTPYQQEIYRMLVTKQMSQVEVADVLDVSKQAIN